MFGASWDGFRNLFGGVFAESWLPTTIIVAIVLATLLLAYRELARPDRTQGFQIYMLTAAAFVAITMVVSIRPVSAWWVTVWAMIAALALELPKALRDRGLRDEAQRALVSLGLIVMVATTAQLAKDQFNPDWFGGALLGVQISFGAFGTKYVLPTVRRWLVPTEQGRVIPFARRTDRAA